MPYFNCVTVRPQDIKVNKDVVLPEFTKKKFIPIYEINHDPMKEKFFLRIAFCLTVRPRASKRHRQFNPAHLCKITTHI